MAKPSMMTVSARRMIGPRLAGLAALLGLWTGTMGWAEAGLITYTESTIATGTLGSHAFSNAMIVLTFVGDTTNVQQTSPSLYVNPAGTATLTVAGLGMATFTDQIQVFDDQKYALGFTDLAINKDILDEAAGAFNTYDLKTAIGPVVGVLYPGTGPSFSTDQGGLVLTSASAMATFRSSTVPEPSSLALCGIAGAFALVIARSGRKRTAG